MPVYDYDLSSAYPSILAKLPNLRYAQYIKTNGNIPKGIFWGILKGKVNITADISPIVHSDGKCYRGEWEDFITTTDWACIKRWNIGSFVLQSGWFIKFSRLEYPFGEAMKKLYALRGTNNKLQARLAKNMAQTVWGKFAERQDEHIFGNYYQPIYASMVTSKVRCMVCDFIHSNNLMDNLISVTVDGCLVTKKVDGIPTERRFGEWRLNGSGEALVMGDPWQWILDKKPLNKTLDEMMEAIHAHPQSHSYFGLGLRFIEQSRLFEKLPITGNDLLNAIHHSKPNTIQ